MHQNYSTENTVILPPAELCSLFSFLRYWHLKFNQFFSHLRGRGDPLPLMYQKYSEILSKLEMPISQKRKELAELRWWQNNRIFGAVLKIHK